MVNSFQFLGRHLAGYWSLRQYWKKFEFSADSPEKMTKQRRRFGRAIKWRKVAGGTGARQPGCGPAVSNRKCRAQLYPLSRESTAWGAELAWAIAAMEACCRTWALLR